MSEVRRSRRDAILEAACREFSNKGFAGARIEEIAKRAGIGKSTVYEYFPSKVDLLQAAAAWTLDWVASDVRAMMQGALPFADKISEYVHYMCRMMRELGHGMLYMQGDKQHTVEVMERCGKRFFESLIEEIAAAAKQGIASGELRADADAHTIGRVVCFVPSPALADEIAQGGHGCVEATVSLLMRGMGK